MRILRVRRGYTTNSSGGNEWVPPKHLTLSADGGTGRAPEGVSVEILSGQGASQWSADAKQVTILATQPKGAQPAGATQSAAPRTGWSTGRGISNLGLMGALLGVVCLLFVVTAFVRRALGKKSERNSSRR